MNDLIDWLRIQINEDNRRNPWPWWSGRLPRIRISRRRARIRREIMAKLWILSWIESAQILDKDKLDILVPIAYIYCDRQGYRKEWSR